MELRIPQGNQALPFSTKIERCHGTGEYLLAERSHVKNDDESIVRKQRSDYVGGREAGEAEVELGVQYVQVLS